jgi:hypothetical protein
MCWSIAYCVALHDIPPELVINRDQTSLHLLPCRGISRAWVGSKEVGQDERSQQTWQPPLIFTGKSDACLPPAPSKQAMLLLLEVWSNCL